MDAEIMKVGDKIESGPWAGFEVISIYTRVQAIADGELVDVSEVAREMGYKRPVAVTRALWGDIEAIPSEHGYQDPVSRLRDVLTVGVLAIARDAAAGRNRNTLVYSLIMHTAAGVDYQVKLHFGPGDDGAPVFTLMRPDED